jgi:hypothetical protein
MDPEDMLEAGLLFGGFEIIETVGMIVLAVAVLAVIAGAIVLLGPDLVTIAVLVVVAIGSGLVGGLVGMKIERLRRKALG